MRKTPSANTLFYGDNLEILRNHIEDESVDLIYLDPPFNSNATYNLLFKAPDGHQSEAQIEAFEDTWHWNKTAEQAFDEVVNSGNSDAAQMLIAMRSFLKENDMMAYLTMMAVRLLELYRVLRSGGSLYLHCDPTASHYLKIVVDAVFGPKSLINEIIWKRYGAHNDVGQGSKHYGRVHDTILFYSKTNERIWNQQFMPLDEEYIRQTYNKIDPKSGKRFTTTPLTGPGGAEKGNPVFEWNGHTRAWRYSKETMQKLHDEEKLYYSKTGYVRQKFFLEDSRGVPVQSVWVDIPSLSGAHAERLGYPTQKPLALLERILSASSKEGDLVLDPFCGCGTTLHAASKLNRRWIGIDITHLAIGLIKRRLTEAFPPMPFDIIGVPKDLGGAQALAEQDKYEFQKWALSMVQAQPYKGGKKGGDGGVDGYIYFKPDLKKTEKAIVSVKGGASLTPAMVKDLIVTVDQEGAKIGIFLTLTPPTKGMVTQASSAGFYKTEYGQFPKIQIVTIEKLFDQSNPIQMPWQDTSTFKKAKLENLEKQSTLDV